MMKPGSTSVEDTSSLLMSSIFLSWLLAPCVRAMAWKDLPKKCQNHHIMQPSMLPNIAEPSATTRRLCTEAIIGGCVS